MYYFYIILFLKIQKRFLVNLPSFHVRVINSRGFKDLPTIYAKSTQPDSARLESMDTH
jgi:hypothetical protein